MMGREVNKTDKKRHILTSTFDLPIALHIILL